MKEKYRDGRNWENFNIAKFDSEGKYDIPIIHPCEIDITAKDDFKGFAARNKVTHDTVLHFFLDDYMFECIWRRPYLYLDLFMKSKAVLSPDFSTYLDFPKAMQIYNTFKRHWLAAYWQSYGVNVIPTIRWGYEDSFDWCFDGEPKNSTIAISTVGLSNSKENKRLFLQGYEEMQKRLSPSKILWYGTVYEECQSDNIINFKPFTDKFKGAKP